MNKNKKNKVIKLDDIPVSSSLGWLAIGDIAFEKWREIKNETNINYGYIEENNAKEK